jgi:hypothetical protein
VQLRLVGWHLDRHAKSSWSVWHKASGGRASRVSLIWNCARRSETLKFKGATAFDPVEALDLAVPQPT